MQRISILATILLILGVVFAATRIWLVQQEPNDAASRPPMETLATDDEDLRPVLESTPKSEPSVRQATAPGPNFAAWNRYRGPNGTGILNDDSIPLRWSANENLRWSTPLTGKGSSSPVLTKNSVLLTTYTGTRLETGQFEDLQRHLVCILRNTGEIAWQRTVDSAVEEDPFVGMGLPEHGYATSTPVTDGAAVFAFFGKSGVHAYDILGEPLWNSDVGTGSNPHGWGSCSSLILFEDLLIVNAAEESSAIIALDKETGREVWRAESPRLPYTFSTPALARVDDNRTDLVIAVLGEVWGLNPRTGKLIWYAKSPIAGNVSPCINVSGNRIYAFGGFRDTGSICVKLGGRGDVTDSHIEWTSKSTSYVVSPVMVGDRFFWVDDNGKYFCQDAETGEIVGRARMPNEIGGGRPVYASMITINGKVLVQSRYGGVFVLDATEELSIFQHNLPLDDAMANATPAAGDGQLFLRSDGFLHCVEAD